MWITRTRSLRLAYAQGVHWDHLFEDLEGQLASEWEAERAALDAEAERLRISRVELRSRLRSLLTNEARLTVHSAVGSAIRGQLSDLGADWIALQPERPRLLCLVPLAAVMTIEVDHGQLLGSLDETEHTASVRERMTLGFVLRDLARRRIAVRIALSDGSDVFGTIDRAGSDHLDLAVHDRGTPRRASEVHAFRMIPLAAVLRVDVDDPTAPR